MPCAWRRNSEAPVSDEERRCSACGDAIDLCEFCEEEDCPVPVCYECLIVALGESVPHP